MAEISFAERLAVARQPRANSDTSKNMETTQENQRSGGLPLLTSDLFGIGGEYGVIYADPPWRYDFAATGNRKIENQYPTMSIDDLCAMKIPAAKNAVLYLWATAPKMPEAMRLIEAWGFGYKSQAVWDKGTAATGYWFRGQHEILIAATRGKMSPPPADKRCGSMLRYPNQSRLARIDGKCNAHSRKPWEVRAMIARWYPEHRKVELFAREKTEGWDVWGNEVASDISLPNSVIGRSPAVISQDFPDKHEQNQPK